MIHFADPYPDELLFSAWVRSAEHLQYPNKYSYFTEITGRRGIKPIVDLPCHLDQFVAALPVPSSYLVETLIREHTFYPYYRPFLPADRAQMLYELMRGENGKHVYWCTNLMNSTIPRRGWFRYCPGCVMEDRARYGECYWHRHHQIHGALVCPRHHLLLTSCTAEEQDLAGRLFISADHLLSPGNETRSAFTPEACEMAERIAIQIAFLLEHPQPTVDLHHCYHLLLEQRHLLKSNGTIRITEATAAFEAMFSTPLLQALHCAFGPQTPPYMTWLSRLLRHRTMCQHPLLHVLTIIFLQGSIEEFFRPLEPKPGPFGLGPWPCLNPACPDYHQLVIPTCQVHHEGKARRCTGYFTCSCGFVYMRILQEEMNPFRKDGTLQYGALWTQKLRDLWTDDQLSLRSMTRQLGVSEMALRRQVVLLGLPPRVQKVSSTIRDRRQQRTEEDRQMWLIARAEDGHLSHTQLWQKYQAVRYRLRRHDPEWFAAHSLPPAPKGQGHRPAQSLRWMPKGRINWSERDTTLAETIQRVGTMMKNGQEKPKRVTMAQLTQAIPELGWLQRRKGDQYPQSRDVLEAVLETHEMFILRKIRWLMHRWEEQQIWLGRQRFLERSGAYRLLQVHAIKEEVNQALTHLMDVLPDQRVTLLS